MDFSQKTLAEAAGVDPWNLRDRFASGDPEEIFTMAKGFAEAADRQGDAVTLTHRGLDTLADGYQVDGATPIDVQSEVALAERNLGDGGEKLGRIAKILADIANDLAERTSSAKASVSTLDHDIATISSGWDTWRGDHPNLPPQDVDSVAKTYFEKAAATVRDTGKPISKSVDDYETLLSGYVKTLSDLGYVAAPDPTGKQGEQVPAWLQNMWQFLGGDVGNFWSGDSGRHLPGSVGAGLLRIFRTGVYLKSGLDYAKFPTFNTGLAGKGLAALGDNIPFLARGAAWLRTPGATTAFRGLGVAGGLVSTALDVKKLVDDGNPVDAFHRDGVGYVEDVARTGFSASTTAFMIAPNPVTGALVIGTGAVWAGAEIVDHWDAISDTASTVWHGTEHLAGSALHEAGDTLHSVVSSLNPFG